MNAYISIARNSRKLLTKEVEQIKAVLGAFGIASNVFVDRYNFRNSEEKEMMQQAMADIDACDLLIAEVSEKAIGVGLEVGYAKAKGKAIVYLRQRDAEHSTTVSGISDHQLTYSGADDLKAGLEKIIKLWITNRL